MAGASSTSSNASITISKESAPTKSEFDKVKKDIYKRTLERNAELETFKDSETAYLKWLADLHETFYPTFAYRNLWGRDLSKDKKTSIYNPDKDKLVDYAYVAFTRIKDPKKEEDGSHSYKTDNGSIKAKSGKIEFVAGYEPAVEGKKPKKKEFSLEDAYNLVLLAMQDRTMMRPNKMKFHGTAKERAMLYFAAERINEQLPESQKLILKGVQPTLLYSGIPLFSKKDDPYDRIFMDILDNTANPNAWEDREKESEKKSEESKNSAEPEDKKDKGTDGPEGDGPAPTTPPNGSGDSSSDTDLEDIPEPESVASEDKGSSPSPSVEKAQTNGSASLEPKDSLLSRILAGEAVSMSFGSQDLTGQDAAFTAPPIQDFKVEDAGEVKEPAAEVHEEIQTAGQPKDESPTEEAYLDHLENVYNNVRNYLVRHEDVLRGQSAYYEIKSLLEIMPPGNLATDDNMNSFAKAMEMEGLIIRDKQTGEPLLRGLAQFTPRDPDYNDIALTLVKTRDANIGLTQKHLAAALEKSIQQDKRHETKGFGPQLSPLLRQDIANGMAQRMLTYLQEDNIIQMKDGKITYVASGFMGDLNLQQNFANATAPAQTTPTPAPQTSPVPKEPQQAQPSPQSAAKPATSSAPDEITNYDRAAIEAIEGNGKRTAPRAPKLTTLDILKEKLNLGSTPIADEHLPAIDEALGEPDFKPHADNISPALADNIQEDIVNTILAEIGHVSVQDAQQQKLATAAKFPPLHAVESARLEDFKTATLFTPPMKDEESDVEALERLTRDLSLLIVENEDKYGAIITDEMKRKNPLPLAAPKLAAE